MMKWNNLLKKELKAKLVTFKENSLKKINKIQSHQLFCSKL